MNTNETEADRLAGLLTESGSITEQESVYAKEASDIVLTESPYMIAGLVPVRNPSLGTFALLTSLGNGIARGIPVGENENPCQTILEAIAVLRHKDPVETKKMVQDRERFDRFVVETGELFPAAIVFDEVIMSTMNLYNGIYTTKASIVPDDKTAERAVRRRKKG